ncbi:hypothetical protein INT43_008108 [Umbelopsis isabellina]|uniref:Uncharacterized protein n=1 Tax=Mortierella isabellina TaxID=91625 RepID=A0A8H7U9H2_MORIS|nr:hypothetical protein INT43_008108 [Umbelopsis isabellina]
MVQEGRATTAEEDNPFLATSDGDTRIEESESNDSVTEEECELNDDEDDEDDDDDENIHSLGIRKLSDIRFPEYVDGLEDPRIKFTREDTFRSVLERKNGRKSDEPPRTPQRQNDTRSSKMTYDDESPCRPDRTPQKTVKRLRREEHFGIVGLCDPEQANSAWLITNKSPKVRSETIHDTQSMAVVVSIGYQISEYSISEEVLELLKVSQNKSTIAGGQVQFTQSITISFFQIIATGRRRNHLIKRQVKE